MTQNKGDESVDNKSKFLSSAEEMKNQLGTAMCLAKWKQVSLHLPTGLNNSCYHPPLHPIDAAELKDNPSALHNTAHKKQQRKIMLKQERPAECNYCWTMEDNGKLSDRHYRSGEPWAAKDFESIMNSTGEEDVVPSYVEVNFNHVCNLSCSYCSPQFSSTWADEVERLGGYPTSTVHNDPSYFVGRNRPIPVRENNPYVEAFWSWWPSLYPELEHFRMTGGEPLLGWQKAYPELLDVLHRNGLRHITFETNGTQELHRDFKEYLRGWHGEITFSVSPKLSVSGEKWEDAIKPEIVWDYETSGVTYLKFVVEKMEDFDELDRAVDEYRLRDFAGPVFVMPVGGVVSVYDGNRINVADEALRRGYWYSPRLHVDLWGNGWGK
jgi:organic radical activating enzyme